MACHVDNVANVVMFTTWKHSSVQSLGYITLSSMHPRDWREEWSVQLSQSCHRRGIPELSCLIWTTSWKNALMIMIELKVSTVQDTLGILTTVSSWDTGVLHSSPTPATSLTELPLGRQSTLRCAPTKPFGTTRTVLSEVTPDVQGTGQENASGMRLI